MTENDAPAFMEAWDQLSMMLAGKEIPDAGLALVFSVLRDYSLDDVMSAMTVHAKRSKWMPAPAEIIEIITGGDKAGLNDEQLIILAREKKTALGAIVRWRITSHTLASAPEHVVMAALRAQRPIIDRFITDAKAGNQLSPVIKRVLINSGAPLHKPSGPGMPALTDRPVHELEAPAQSLPPADPVRAAQVQEMARGVAGAIQ